MHLSHDRFRNHLSDSWCRMGGLGPSPSAQTGSMDRLNMLVADGNRHMRVLIKGLLAAIGVRNIREAADGADAFKEMLTFPVDVIITEMMMAPLDGIEFTKLIRTASDSPNPAVPILMVSAYTEWFHVVAARDAGVTEFLAKPFSAEDLSIRLYSVLHDKRAFVRSKNFCGPDRRRHPSIHRGSIERRRDLLAAGPCPAKLAIRPKPIEPGVVTPVPGLVDVPSFVRT